MTEYLVPESTTLILGTCATLCFIIPIIALIAYKKNTRAKIKPAIYGAIMFIAFSLGVEQLLHIVFLLTDNPISRFVNSNVIVYCIYGALAAAVCEEMARWIAFKMLKEDCEKKESAIMYGIGHGGIECFIVGGLSLFVSMIYASVLNSSGYEEFINGAGPEGIASMIETADSLMYTEGWVFFVSVFERVVSFILQISLTIFVYRSAKDITRKYFLFIAMGIHFAFDFIAALYQVGIIGNLLVEELILAVSTAVITFFAVKVFKAQE